MMMMKSILFAGVVFDIIGTIYAATNVAVLEFGNRGTVRATTNNNNISNREEDRTTVAGVASLWSALSSKIDRSASSKLQHSGMSVIPDLFRQPDSNLVIGISDIDVDSLAAFMMLLDDEDDQHSSVVGVLKVPGKNVKTLLAKVTNFVTTPIESFDAKCDALAMEGNEMQGLHLSFAGRSVEDVPAALLPGLRKLKARAVTSGRTLVVHLVVETEIDDVSSPTARRLQQNENQQQQQSGGYYGYGYYKNGVWVTPYKTMFQIQYFNVVTWTAIGLAFAMGYTFYLMLFMPLEPDTLLFGESAKMVGEN